ncbi:MAG: hypothetical protein A3G87_05345 [Omnitrophica bacterium RIFCSPLOWO2_12_FULL_50_11]|nr:MAG: hypothetical protein A3G87_05345 [Omnitrophica bacterium RIFCSPLOWO2_12_FULL_50_11]
MLKKVSGSVLVIAVCILAGCSDGSVSKPPNTIVTASSQQDNSDLGPQGLLLAKAPGWHSQSSPSYPQFITVDFGAAQSMRRIGLLPQVGQPSRGPKAVTIEVSEDGKSWRSVGNAVDACVPNAVDGWFDINLSSEVTSRYLRLRILSNCGAPDLLTLQGLRAAF